MKLRVGLVGLGTQWEVRHRAALRALSDRFEVRAVFDQVALRAEQAAREFGAQQVDGFRALAARDDIDAVLMLSPQWYGCLPMLAACDAGKAIYCAFSMELDLEQARQVKEYVERAGVAFMAEFPRRQSPATLRLKELIATRLGAPRLLFCHTRVPVETPGVGLRAHVTSPTSDLIELVDWCTYVVGHAPTSVVGLRHMAANGALEDDYQMMSLDFSGAKGPGAGATAQISCGRYMQSAWHEALTYRPPAALQVACENGIAFIDLPSTLIWFDNFGRHQESLDSERPVGEQLLSQFYRSVTSLVRNTSNLEDSYRALEVVLQARASHVQCRRMPLTE